MKYKHFKQALLFKVGSVNKLCQQMCRIKILCMIIALQLYLYIELQQKNVWEHNVFYLIFTVKKNKIFYQKM